DNELGVRPYFRMGTFVYAYDENGKLVSRHFLDRVNGVILVSDSLAYKTDEKDANVLHISHLFRISGVTGWLTLDAQMWNKADNLLLTWDYGKSAGVDHYEYYGNGKLSKITFAEQSGQLVYTDTYCRTGTRLDSLVSVTYSANGKKRTGRKEYEFVFVYDAGGMISKVTDYEYVLPVKKSRNRKKPLLDSVYETSYSPLQ
ncbi:MAG TPA: hypothetical protein VFU15_00395, partial [Bacteroidia bacterium]|nr:hypothetical protein [Bacteroidia bacterium]